MARIAVVAMLASECNGHGTITYPKPRNPVGELWFTEGAAIGCEIPQGRVSPMKWYLPWPLGGFCKDQIEPTLTDPVFRTYWQSPKLTPWHAPGIAPVYSPCGLTAGGYTTYSENGDVPPPGFEPGFDGLGLPSVGKPQMWPAGSKQEVWWSIAANHGGGYSYRLCPKSKPLTEECFQGQVLKFASNDTWIVYGDFNSTNRTRIQANRTTEGTHPSGSQWTKVPIPSCAGAGGGGLGEKCDEPQFPSPVPGLWGNGPSNSCAGQPESGHTPAQLAWCSKKNGLQHRRHGRDSDRVAGG
jgi:hypothetical protein